MPTFVTLPEIQSAAARIAGTAVLTPLLPLPGCPDHSPAIFIKAESAQPIGSFKLRGAFNMISQLSPEQLDGNYVYRAATLRVPPAQPAPL